MNGKSTDVHQTLSYSSAKIDRKLLGLGLVALVAGTALAYTKSSFGAHDRIMLAFTLVMGAGCTLYGLFRLLVPGKPALVLSPAGLHLHIDWVKDILIPWHQVRGVDTVDISRVFRGRKVMFRGVTVVLVSKAFYDRYIHVNSWFLRGPGWETNFVPKGRMVQIALHQEALPASADSLRTAVETRWQAFRNVPAPERQEG